MPHKRCFQSSGLGLRPVLWSTHIPSYLPNPCCSLGHPTNQLSGRASAVEAARLRGCERAQALTTTSTPSRRQTPTGHRKAADAGACARSQASQPWPEQMPTISYLRESHSWTIYSPLNSPGQHTGVGSLSLLQGIFPTHRSPPLQADSLPAKPQGKPISYLGCF